MLKKQRAPRNRVRVTFTLPNTPASRVDLVGDFNGWTPPRVMRRVNGGEWQLALDLEPGREFQFRYLVDESDWLNDPAADKYVPNPYGGDNSVVVT